MPNYTCTICSRSFRRKDYLIKHYNRKNPCKPVDNLDCLSLGKSKVNILEVKGKPKVNILEVEGKPKVNISIKKGKHNSDKYVYIKKFCIFLFTLIPHSS